MDFQAECCQMCVTVAQKLIEKSPLEYKMARAATALNPSLILSNRILSERRMTELILISL